MFSLWCVVKVILGILDFVATRNVYEGFFFIYLCVTLSSFLEKYVSSLRVFRLPIGPFCDLKIFCKLYIILYMELADLTRLFFQGKRVS